MLFAPNEIKKLLAIGTMPKSAAVATRKGDHEAPPLLGPYTTDGFFSHGALNIHSVDGVWTRVVRLLPARRVSNKAHAMRCGAGSLGMPGCRKAHPHAAMPLLNIGILTANSLA